MATTTGTHSLSYPDSGATNWFAAFASFAQGITDHLDQPSSMEFATLKSLAGITVVEISDSFSGSWLDIDSGNASNSVKLTASGAATDLELVPGASKSVILDGINWPQADGSANHILYTDGSGQLSFAILDITLDTAPVLGADLDIGGYDIITSDHVDIKLADDAGTNQFRIKDSNGTKVAHIDSDGDALFVDAAMTSATITTATVTNLTATNLTFPSASIQAADLDISTFSTTTSVDNSADYYLVYDGSSAIYRKMLGQYLTSNNGAVAWAHIATPGGTPTITGNNISSITDNGTGDFTLNFDSNTVTTTTYTVVATAGDASGNYLTAWEDTDGRSTSSVQIKVGNTALVDPGSLQVIILENQV